MGESKLKLGFAWLLIVVLSMHNCASAWAETANKLLDDRGSLIPEISEIRKVGEPITLTELGLESWLQPLEHGPTETQLLKLSIRLRDLARYLGSGWPVAVPLPNDRTEEVSRSRFRITDFRAPDGSWLTITVGHALRMVTQELELLPKSEGQPLIDFLVKDEATDSYRRLIGVPLVRYCNELLKWKIR